ncbi:FAD dependent oxidoreductase superfamily [Patellaria atrata CBS 101060]|uniref:FAD dependent oxidoreductase superfamily n=1 Tax=Patellaria atrata CBS 101060 TaxID=1346257 RepID=A0A9P4SCR5_9PEZI|nr:FAD dependent oxidoreductase superfamily [Patellaria atrata CBS 101060]
MATLPYPQRPIIILGAGIIGLTAAHTLLQHGFHVILVAAFLPGDTSHLYASAWAGAAWHAAANVSDEKKGIQVMSHRVLRKLAREEPEVGVRVVRSREYLKDVPDEKGSIWEKKVLSNFRVLARGEFPENFAAGWEYDGIVIDPTKHLPWLMKSIDAAGGQSIQRRVRSVLDLFYSFPETYIIINCSGLGSKELGGVNDRNCFPERGQNVLLNGKEYTYIIPRPMRGILVLGGVKQRDNISSDIDMDIVRNEILRAHRSAPEVVPKDPPASSLDYIVGIRPSRDGGFQLKKETIGLYTPLHAYEFGGQGYAYSYSVAYAIVADG